MSLWYARLLPHAARLDQHVAVLHASDADWTALEQRSPDNRRIDVWWFDDDSSRLALLLAYLMTRSELLDEATLRMLAPASADTAQKVRTNLTHRLEEFRIDAAIDVVANDGGEVSTYARSQDTAFVLLPLRLDGMHMLDPTGGAAANLLDMLPVVAMVAACGDVKAYGQKKTPRLRRQLTATRIPPRMRLCWHPTSHQPREPDRRLVPVVVWLVGAVDRYVDILSLNLGELGELHAKRVEMQARHFLVELFRQHVDLFLVFALVVVEGNLREHWLVKEADITKLGCPVAQLRFSSRPSARPSRYARLETAIRHTAA